MRIRTIAVSVLLLCSCVKKSTYQKALDENARLQREHGDTQAKLVQELDLLKGQILELNKNKDAQVAQLQGEKSATEKELAELRRQKEAAEKRIAAYKALQDKFRALVDTGKLQVVFRNGQMTLEAAVGDLVPERLGGAIEGRPDRDCRRREDPPEFKDRRFIVAGHTDNQPIKTAHSRTTGTCRPRARTASSSS